MSTEFWRKIGEWLQHNQADIALVVGFISVALVSFGAGYLSAPEIIKNPVLIEEPNFSIASTTSVNEKGLFVASRGGAKYYWPWCSWGERIKTENQVWFNSETEAKAAGFSPGECIQRLAPAGYQPQ